MSLLKQKSFSCKIHKGYDSWKMFSTFKSQINSPSPPPATSLTADVFSRFFIVKVAAFRLFNVPWLGQTFALHHLTTGVLQGSVLGPLCRVYHLISDSISDHFWSFQPSRLAVHSPLSLYCIFFFTALPSPVRFLLASHTLMKVCNCAAA